MSCTCQGDIIEGTTSGTELEELLSEFGYPPVDNGVLIPVLILARDDLDPDLIKNFVVDEAFERRMSIYADGDDRAEFDRGKEDNHCISQGVLGLVGNDARYGEGGQVVSGNEELLGVILDDIEVEVPSWGWFFGLGGVLEKFLGKGFVCLARNDASGEDFVQEHLDVEDEVEPFYILEQLWRGRMV